MFHSKLVFCELKLQELMKRTSSLPRPNSFRTWVCFDLLIKVVSSCPDQPFKKVMAWLIDALLTAIYSSTERNGTITSIPYSLQIRQLEQILRDTQATRQIPDLDPVEKREPVIKEWVGALVSATNRWNVHNLAFVFYTWRNWARNRRYRSHPLVSSTGLVIREPLVVKVARMKERHDVKNFARLCFLEWRRVAARSRIEAMLEMKEEYQKNFEGNSRISRQRRRLKYGIKTKFELLRREIDTLIRQERVAKSKARQSALKVKEMQVNKQEAQTLVQYFCRHFGSISELLVGSLRDLQNCGLQDLSDMDEMANSINEELDLQDMLVDEFADDDQGNFTEEDHKFITQRKQELFTTCWFQFQYAQTEYLRRFVPHGFGDIHPKLDWEGEDNTSANPPSSPAIGRASADAGGATGLNQGDKPVPGVEDENTVVPPHIQRFRQGMKRGLDNEVALLIPILKARSEQQGSDEYHRQEQEAQAKVKSLDEYKARLAGSDSKGSYGGEKSPEDSTTSKGEEKSITTADAEARWSRVLMSMMNKKEMHSSSGLPSIVESAASVCERDLNVDLKERLATERNEELALKNEDSTQQWKEVNLDEAFHQAALFELMAIHPALPSDFDDLENVIQEYRYLQDAEADKSKITEHSQLRGLTAAAERITTLFIEQRRAAIELNDDWSTEMKNGERGVHSRLIDRIKMDQKVEEVKLRGETKLELKPYNRVRRVLNDLIAHPMALSNTGKARKQPRAAPVRNVRAHESCFSVCFLLPFSFVFVCRVVSIDVFVHIFDFTFNYLRVVMSCKIGVCRHNSEKALEIS